MDSSASDRQLSNHYIYNISTVRSKVAVSVSSFGYEWITTNSTLYNMAVPIEEVNEAITLNKALLAKSTSQNFGNIMPIP